jgi:spermidine synthase
MHGVQTTIVEIDPAVHRLAVDYFSLPKNHSAVIEDATIFVKKDLLRIEQEQKSNPSQDGRYNYIIHDVFTGGAEPIDLFTVEFIQSLSDLLKPNGVIAIVCLHIFLPLLSLTSTLELRNRPISSIRSLYIPNNPLRISKLPPLPREPSTGPGCHPTTNQRFHKHGNILPQIQHAVCVPQTKRA